MKIESWTKQGLWGFKVGLMDETGTHIWIDRYLCFDKNPWNCKVYQSKLLGKVKPPIYNWHCQTWGNFPNVPITGVSPDRDKHKRTRDKRSGGNVGGSEPLLLVVVSPRAAWLTPCPDSCSTVGWVTLIQSGYNSDSQLACCLLQRLRDFIEINGPIFLRKISYSNNMLKKW